MRLQLQTWQEVASYLTRHHGVIIPIGSTEQHGPTGLIGTDAITAEVIAQRAGEEMGILVAPTIPVGMAHHHMAFAGSMTLRPSTLIALVRDQVLSLAAHGFRRFLFVNGHGGNIPAVQSAFYEIYEEQRVTRGEDAPSLACHLCNWFTAKPVHELAARHFGDAEGGHATPSEVAVTQYAYPEAIKTAPLSPTIAPSGRFTDSRDFRQRFPDGRIGSNPGLATPELGADFVRVAVDHIVATYTDFLNT